MSDSGNIRNLIPDNLLHFNKMNLNLQGFMELVASACKLSYRPLTIIHSDLLIAGGETFLLIIVLNKWEDRTTIKITNGL